MQYGVSRMLDMRDCTRQEWVGVNSRMAGLESQLQPFWFRPFFRLPRVRRRLGYDHSPRLWEYPWAVLGGNLTSGLRVLDVGSGGSAFPLFLALEGFEVHAVDPSLSEGIEWLDWRKRIVRSLGIAAAWGLPPRSRRLANLITYRPYTLQDLRYTTEYFDRVFCLSVMEHVPETDWAQCIAEMSRVLRYGGRLVLTLDMGTREANQRQYMKLLTEPSLKLIGEVDYAVPISREDQWVRHQRTYETLGLVWEKV